MTLSSQGGGRASSARKFVRVKNGVVSAAAANRVIGPKVVPPAGADRTKVTSDRTKILAAQLRRDVDVKTGRKTPEWIAKLANKGDLSQMAKTLPEHRSGLRLK